MNFPQLLFMAGWVALSAPAALAVEPPQAKPAQAQLHLLPIRKPLQVP